MNWNYDLNLILLLIILIKNISEPLEFQEQILLSFWLCSNNGDYKGVHFRDVTLLGQKALRYLKTKLRLSLLTISDFFLGVNNNPCTIHLYA